MGFGENEHMILQELDTVLGQINQDDVQKALNLIEASEKIFFHGLGRAGYAGKSFVMRLMHMGREVYAIGDTNTPNFSENDLMIICSASGETSQFVAMANKAKTYGGKLLVFTSTPGSTLEKMADAAILIPAPCKDQEKSSFTSVQPMASLFEQAILLTGDAMVLTMMEGRSDEKDMFSRHSNLE